ncbi:MAG: ribosome-associated translation inhibitor RaiA [Candidatus Hydrogenedentota bacterium]
MNVSISGRHIDITEGLRDHIDGGLEKVTDHFNKVIDIDVILDVQRHRHIAEINLHANGLRINAKEASGDLYSSFDSAVTKIDKQIRKHKDRINRHQPRTSGEKREYQLKVLEVPFLSEEHADQPASELAHTIIERKKVEIKPMTVEEAAMQIDLLHEPFLVFSNAETNKINVVYKLEDGNFGLIEPQE